MELLCSHCRRPYVQTVRIHGIADRMLSLIYAYPFRCQVCRHRFHLLQWGVHHAQAVSERREYLRRPVRTPAKLLNERGDPVGDGIVKDLSMGGCSIETEAHLTMGSLLRLKIDAIDQQPPITVERAIVRSVRISQNRGNGIGVEFLRFDSDENRLSEYMLALWMDGTQIARRGQLEEPLGVH